MKHILVQFAGRTKYNPLHFDGVREIGTKKEFMEIAGKMWDEVVENPLLITSIQLINKENC